jgi:hypothetical protein
VPRRATVSISETDWLGIRWRMSGDGHVPAKALPQFFIKKCTSVQMLASRPWGEQLWRV